MRAAVRRMFGYDFFVSYAREDGREYAQSLVSELSQPPHKYRCFLDNLEMAGGSPWRPSIRNALRRSSVMIVVASPSALKSDPIYEEVSYFAPRSRPLIPISFAGILRSLPPTHRLFQAFVDRARPVEEIDPAALDAGHPSPSVVQYLNSSFGFVRIDRIRIAALAIVVLVFAALAAASMVGAAVAIRQAAEARREAARADFWVDRRLFALSLDLENRVEGARTATTVRYDPQSGLDFGMYVGWDQRSGRLHNLLSKMRAANPSLFDAIFADGNSQTAGALLAFLAEPNGGLASEGSGDHGFPLGSADWQARFRRAGAEPAFGRVQYQEAFADFQRYRRTVASRMPALHTERGILFMVDVLVQHGPNAARRFYETASANGGTEPQLLQAVQDLSVKQMSRLPFAVRWVGDRRNLFRTTDSLLDEVVDRTGWPSPAWSEDLAAWFRHMVGSTDA